MLIKIWLNDDCRRFSVDPACLTYKLLKSKVKQIYQLDQDESFILKYKDQDGDLITVSNSEELNEIIENDMTTCNFIFKLFVFLTYTASSDQVDRDLSTENTLDEQIIDANRPKFGTDFSDREIVDILRDISYYITARDMTPAGVNSWVSSEKSLITPNNVPALNRTGFSRMIRSKAQGPDDVPFSNAPQTWTIYQVTAWLSSIGFDEFSPQFHSNDITGEVLLDLTHENLKELGMNSTGKRIRLLKFIQGIRNLDSQQTSHTPVGISQQIASLQPNPLNKEKRTRNFGTTIGHVNPPGSKFGTMRSKAGIVASVLGQIQASPTKKQYHSDLFPERF